MNKKKIVCVHLFNNYSGSPKVLQQIINGLVYENYEVDLIVNKSEGFLSGIEDIHYNYITYKWHKNKVLTFLYLIIAQVQIFIKILTRYSSVNNVIYINTITPFGAALACKLTKNKLIYHVHEKYVNSNLIHKLCEKIYKNSISYSIFVSKYLENCYSIKPDNSIVIYNTLDNTFKNIASEFLKNREIIPTTILMICSLRDFKGVYEFVEISKQLSEFNFELVVSSTKEAVDNFVNEVNPGGNLKIFDNQTNLHPFYQRAKLLLNLSKPDKWIETFGLTILEAMEYGIPAIVPNVGGPLELITNGFNGFLIDPYEIEDITRCIKFLLTDSDLYFELSNNALAKSKEFDSKKMSFEIVNLIRNL